MRSTRPELTLVARRRSQTVAGEDSISPARNVILGSLQGHARESLRSNLTVVELKKGQLLCHAGERSKHVHFPTGGLLSCLGLTADGLSVEVGAVSREGVIGLPALLGCSRHPFNVAVQVAGWAWRIEASHLRDHARNDANLSDVLLAYAGHALVEIANTAMCHRFHDTLQRLCRWLLTASDLIEDDTLPVTQEQLSVVLGVQRTGVTSAALELQDAGAIWYRRGRVRITHRRRLELSACGCYAVMRESRMARSRAPLIGDRPSMVA